MIVASYYFKYISIGYPFCFSSTRRGRGGGREETKGNKTAL